MKSSYVDVINIRRMAFASIARMAYEDKDLNTLHNETYKALPGEVARYRENIFRERAVFGERLRMALGLDARTAADTGPITEGIEEIDVDTRVFKEPLVSVIKIACEACPERFIHISDNCRFCLAHPCSNVCPKNAISPGDGRMVIDQEKCIKCKKCLAECPYHAILETGRPCAEACGVKAIASDYLGRAEIEPEKCVACGACITACPFGAITDKSQIYQVVKAIKKNDTPVYGIIAPSFTGQFGSLITSAQVKAAIRQLGFADVIEVGLGADLTTMNEAKEFLETVPKERPYMGTSCCFSWKMMVQKNFPDQDPLISESSTPMIYTAKQMKKRNANAKIVFIGPCISKKLEGLQPHVRDYVDFVITFEELMGMFVARDIEPGAIETDEEMQDASTTGRGYAVQGGVAKAVVARAKEIDPDREIVVENADGLADCVMLIRMAKAGKKNGMLLEGMACSGGCIGGPGTVVPRHRSRKANADFAAASPFVSPADNTNIPEEDKL
ncbi:MAG: 4Fe-4S dicluster domain-containing protein [Peptoniphilaceae bacterium]|nr:4Fe-4S dicluster domain-containing protein [Peptoniphilaceae bacterium]MDY5766649.1 4Fe-4S dicluster domain-containing protein [Peptoniphilaceae bacterium]